MKCFVKECLQLCLNDNHLPFKSNSLSEIRSIIYENYMVIYNEGYFN